MAAAAKTARQRESRKTAAKAAIHRTQQMHKARKVSKTRLAEMTAELDSSHALLQNMRAPQISTTETPTQQTHATPESVQDVVDILRNL